MGVRVDSDLTFSVDLGHGRATGRVEAAGSHVRVVTDDPATVWDGAFGSTSTGGGVLRALADTLAEQGVTVEVGGPAGMVATVGAGIDSGLGRVVTGSRRVRLGGPRAVGPLARARVVSAVETHRTLLALVGGAVAGAFAVLAASRSRRR